jgi:hypothetical protein
MFCGIVFQSGYGKKLRSASALPNGSRNRAGWLAQRLLRATPISNDPKTI